MKEVQKLHAVVKIPRNIKSPVGIQLIMKVSTSTKPKVPLLVSQYPLIFWIFKDHQVDVYHT